MIWDSFSHIFEVRRKMLINLIDKNPLFFSNISKMVCLLWIDFLLLPFHRNI